MKLSPAPRLSRCHPAAAGAFTLIEVMIVVAIIGLLAAAGLPVLGKAMQKEGMRLAVSDFEDVCFKAREKAIVNNQTTAVVIYPHDRCFGVEGVVAGDLKRTVDSHSGKATSSTLPEGVEFGSIFIYRREFSSSDYAKIFFHADGTCDEASVVLIYKSQEDKISLEYATGMPTVAEAVQ